MPLVAPRSALLGLAVLALLLASTAVMLGSGGVTEASADWGNASDALEESITVHGDWNVDVLDPDGRVDQSAAFANDLTGSGAEALTQLLTGAASAGGWQIQLGSDVTGPCSASACLIWSELDVDSTGQSFRLSGTTAADREGVVDSVATLLVRCDGAARCERSSASLDTSLATIFTATTIDALTIKPGQHMRVTVAISFD